MIEIIVPHEEDIEHRILSIEEQTGLKYEYARSIVPPNYFYFHFEHSELVEIFKNNLKDWEYKSKVTIRKYDE